MILINVYLSHLASVQLQNCNVHTACVIYENKIFCKLSKNEQFFKNRSSTTLMYRDRMVDSCHRRPFLTIVQRQIQRATKFDYKANRLHFTRRWRVVRLRFFEDAKIATSSKYISSERPIYIDIHQHCIGGQRNWTRRKPFQFVGVNWTSSTFALFGERMIPPS